MMLLQNLFKALNVLIKTSVLLQKIFKEIVNVFQLASFTELYAVNKNNKLAT